MYKTGLRNDNAFNATYAVQLRESQHFLYYWIHIMSICSLAFPKLELSDSLTYCRLIRFNITCISHRGHRIEEDCRRSFNTMMHLFALRSFLRRADDDKIICDANHYRILSITTVSQILMLGNE